MAQCLAAHKKKNLGERHREGNRASEGKTVFTIHYILYTLLNAYAEQLFKLYKFRTAFLY